MVDIIKQDMTDIWASSGDVQAPSSSKIATGWIVEAVPRQWWNWFENRQDTNIAYILQKGLPEWDVDTQYLTNKSYVQRNGIVYKCILTNTNTDPSTTPANWVKAFPESTIGLETLKTITPATDTFPYFTGVNTASVTGLSAFMRTVLDDVDAATARTTLGAQQADATLTALAGLATATNKLPYFTGTDVATLTDFTAFARTLLDDSDATTARATLGVYSTADSDAALAAGLASKQPLATNLTNLAALTITPNTMPYYNGTSVLGLSAVTTYGRGFLNLADAASSRTYIGADDASNLTTGTIPLARIPTNLTGVNAATATKLQTARTIQGVSFDGTANITLSVVDKDSATGSATLPAGTTAQRTPTPANGQLRYNSDTNEFEGYINGAWGGIGGGTPLFTPLWWPSRASIPAGYVAADGQLLSRTSYQAAFAGVSGGNLPVVTEAVWLATSTSRGCYTLGNGTTTFRIPDLNGIQSGTVAAPFLRGDGTNSAGTPGTFQNDQFQGSTDAYPGFSLAYHTAGYSTITVASSPVLRNIYMTDNGSFAATGTAKTTPVTDGVNGTPRVGSETRPVNVTGVFIIKLIGGASAASQEDASIAVAALDAKLAYVSGRNRIINGDCKVQQRGSVVFAAGQTGYGGPDRYIAVNAGTGSFTQSGSTLSFNGAVRNAVAQTVGALATNYTGGNAWQGICQPIEGVNCADMQGSPAALSFLFNASVAGTYSASIRDSNATHSYVTTFTVAVANTPQRITLSIPTLPANLVIPNTTAAGLYINIGAINTGTLQAPSINGWLSGNYITGAGSTNWATVVSTSYIAMTELQFEVGTVATPFEHIPFSANLAACQRYYTVGGYRFDGYGGAGTYQSTPIAFPVSMRVTPTLVDTHVSQINCTTGPSQVNTNVLGFSSARSIVGSAGAQYIGTYTASAEL